MIPVLIGMLIYGIVHSLLAALNVKDAFRRRFGERAYHGLYRLLYNLFALVTIVPIALLVVFRPGETVWQVDLRWELPLLAIQALGLVGFVLALLKIDLGRFGGLRQLRAYLNGEPLPLPPEGLQTSGVYAWVRHPLYLFSMMVIWPVTTMTGAYLGFCIGTTLYFLVGSYFEEKRMLSEFGQTYRDYRARVPWLLPLPRLRG
jgi:methanethiol S-methyltransferase